MKITGCTNVEDFVPYVSRITNYSSEFDGLVVIIISLDRAWKFHRKNRHDETLFSLLQVASDKRHDLISLPKPGERIFNLDASVFSDIIHPFVCLNQEERGRRMRMGMSIRTRNPNVIQGHSEG